MANQSSSPSSPPVLPVLGIAAVLVVGILWITPYLDSLPPTTSLEQTPPSQSISDVMARDRAQREIERQAELEEWRANRQQSRSSESPPPPQPSTSQPSQPWYSGGNLHNATSLQWRNATDRNQLATSMDWVITMWRRDGYSDDLIQSMRSGGGWRVAATQVKDCVNEAYTLGATAADPQTLAILCYTQ